MGRGYYYPRRYYGGGYGRSFKRYYKKRKSYYARGEIGARQRAAVADMFKELKKATRSYGKYNSSKYKEAVTALRGGPYTISGVGDYHWKEGSSPSIGARLGAFLGDKAQAVLGSITGLGDYSVRQNTLVNNPPSVRNNSARTVTLSHREYIGDVVTGDAESFDMKSYPINPGNPTTFPWLSSIAKNYQQYRLDGVLFQFKSMSADALNSTNTALGQVIMATNYNVNQPLFDSKYEMENTEFSTSVKPSCSAMHPIECARAESTLNELYVAPGGVVPPGEQRQFYDFGNFQIATNGFQAPNVNIGELWVTYEVTLIKPILTDVNGTAALWNARLTSPGWNDTAVVGGTPYTLKTPSNANGPIGMALWLPSQRTPQFDTLRCTYDPETGILAWEPPSGEGTGFPEGTIFRVSYISSGRAHGLATGQTAAPSFSLVGYPDPSDDTKTIACFDPVTHWMNMDPNDLGFPYYVNQTLNSVDQYAVIYLKVVHPELPASIHLLPQQPYYGAPPTLYVAPITMLVEQVREDTFDDLTDANYNVSYAVQQY